METAVDIKFADGEYRCWLPLPQIFELERNCGDVSILILEERMRMAIGQEPETGEFVFTGGGAAMTKDIRETIRLGLIGGNHAITDAGQIEVGPLKAKDLVDAYVYPARPLGEGLVIAWRILSAAVFGVQLKKKASAAPAKPRSRSKKVEQ